MESHSWSHRALVVVVVAAGVLACSQTVSAEPLLENDRLRVGIGGVVRTGGGIVSIQDTSSPDYGFFVQNARIKLGVDFKEYASFVVQYGAGSGDATLVDAFGTLTAFEPFFLRAGRFKTPVSEESLISAGALPFATRALLNSFVPGRRTGLEAYGRIDAGSVVVQPQVGLFQPQATAFAPAPPGIAARPQGQLLTGRIRVETPAEIDAHLGYAGHVFAENRLDASHPQNASGSDQRVFDYDHPLDLAVTYKPGRWDLHLEGVTVLDPPSDDSVVGGYVHGGYRFGATDSLQWKPMAAYDVASAGNLVHRATLGLNVHWWNTPLYSILNFRFQTTEDRTDDGVGTPPDRRAVYLMLAASL